VAEGLSPCTPWQIKLALGLASDFCRASFESRIPLSSSRPNSLRKSMFCCSLLWASRNFRSEMAEEGATGVATHSESNCDGGFTSAIFSL
jgi:hypothetical protein